MTRDSKLHTLYGLKFNPFLPDLPLEALYVPAPLESFLQRCETHVAEGGFAMLTGVPGLGKSSAMRLLDARLSRTRDVLVRSLTYPQCRIGDFYRELGDAFGVSLTWSNRWGSFKMVATSGRLTRRPPACDLFSSLTSASKCCPPCCTSCAC